MTNDWPEWCERELYLQTTTRRLPVWIAEAFWKTSTEIHIYQFVHVSTRDPALLAYTESFDKGERGIHTKIKPGKYLSKYFGDALTEREIKFMAEWQLSGAKPVEPEDQRELKIAMTPEEIRHVYAEGPASCMDGRCFNRDKLPAVVYGAGDLGVAYLEGTERARKGAVIARCLVWPEKKLACRIYPTESNWEYDGYGQRVIASNSGTALKTLLKAAGYRFLAEGGASFNGARLLKIPHGTNGYFVMPSFDFSGRFRDEGEFFVLHPQGAWGGGGSSGYVSCNPVPIGKCHGCGREMLKGEAHERIVRWTGANNLDGANHLDWAVACMECLPQSFVCAATGHKALEKDRHPDYPEILRGLDATRTDEWLRKTGRTRVTKRKIEA